MTIAVSRYFVSQTPTRNQAMGRKPIGDTAMSNAERQRRKRAKARQARAKSAWVPHNVPDRPNVEKYDPDNPPYEQPDAYRVAYMLRADTAGWMAFYDESRWPPDDDILAMAKYANRKWTELVQKLERSKQTNPKRWRKGRGRRRKPTLE